MVIFHSYLDNQRVHLHFRWEHVAILMGFSLAQVRDVKENRYKAKDVVAIKRGFDVPGALLWNAGFFASFLFGGMSYG